MSKLYKIILVAVVAVGLGLLGWAALVWAPRYAGSGAPSESITKLNQMDQQGFPASAVVNLVDDQKVSLVSLADFHGVAPVVVHFWASWCGPCVEELPALIEFAKKNEGLRVLAVAEDQEPRDATRFIGKFTQPSANFVTLFDPDLSAAEKFGTEKLPETFVFCPSGKLLKKFGSAVLWKQMEFSAIVEACRKI